MRPWVKAIGLLGWIVLCYGAAAVASIPSPRIYATMAKPEWAPPAWLFGPVWTFLYTAMAVAAWGVWTKVGTLKSRPIVLFGVQLVLNILWSWWFFGWRMGLVAFVDIVLLALLLVVLVVEFGRVRWWCGALMVPYVAWVSFAAVLNFVLWWMNRSSDVFVA